MPSVVSIKEVAARAGVSLGTVSKVLNESAGAQIASGTRERVRRAARELGYSPNAVARALVRKQLDTIGVVLTGNATSPIGSPFFATLFDAVLEGAAARGQNTTVFTGRRWVDGPTSLPAFRDGRCDGLLLFYQLPESDIISTLLDARMPVVLVNDVRDDPRLSYVDVDNVAAFRSAVEHLIGLGHRRIALLSDWEHLTYVPARRDGYRRALGAAGIPFDERLVVVNGSLDEMTGHFAAVMSLPPGERPTAVAAMGDGSAIGAIAALRRLGWRVPEDVSVTGFNDDGTAEREHVALTTVRQPYRLIGETAVDLLLEQIEDIDRRGRRVIVPTDIVTRGTTAAPPSQTP